MEKKNIIISIVAFALCGATFFNHLKAEKFKMRRQLSEKEKKHEEKRKKEREEQQKKEREEFLENPNIKDNDGNTALHRATKKGDLKTVTSLLNMKKIEPSIKDKNGNTPLHLAVINGHLDIVKALKKANAQISAKNNDKDENLRTPIQIADALAYSFEKLSSICSQIMNPWISNISIESGFKKLKRLQACLKRYKTSFGTGVEGLFTRGEFLGIGRWGGMENPGFKQEKTLIGAAKDRKTYAKGYKLFTDKQLATYKDILKVLNEK